MKKKPYEVRSGKDLPLKVRGEIASLCKVLGAQGYKYNDMVPIFGLKKSYLYNNNYHMGLKGRIIPMPVELSGEDDIDEVDNTTAPNNETKDRRHALRVYLSGAISGRPLKEVAEEFAKGASRLMSIKGFAKKVVNPLNNGLDDSASWKNHMVADIKLLLDCDIIYVVGDISTSRGAKLELEIAKQLGLLIVGYKYSDDKIVQEVRRYKRNGHARHD